MFWIARTAYLMLTQTRLEGRHEQRQLQLDELHRQRFQAGASLLLGAGLAALWPPALLLLLAPALRLGKLAALESQLESDQRRESRWARRLHQDLWAMQPERHRQALHTCNLANPTGRAHLRAWIEKDPRWRSPLEGIERIAEGYPDTGRALLSELLSRPLPVPLAWLAAARLHEIEPRPVIAELARRGSTLCLRFLALQSEGSRAPVFRCLLRCLARGKAVEETLREAARVAIRLEDPLLLEGLMQELARLDPRVRHAIRLPPAARCRAYREILTGCRRTSSTPARGPAPPRRRSR